MLVQKRLGCQLRASNRLGMYFQSKHVAAQIQVKMNRRWLVDGLCLTRACWFLYQESTGLLTINHVRLAAVGGWSVVRHEDGEQAHRK